MINQILNLKTKSSRSYRI